jgi:hypothetical protein
MTPDTFIDSVNKLSKAAEETGRLRGRLDFENCVKELQFTKRSVSLSDYSTGWNDATDQAILLIQKYMFESD